MIKKHIIYLVLVLPMALISPTIFSQNTISNSSPNNDFIFCFKNHSIEQILDTANYFFSKSSLDTALIFYNLIINTPAKNNSSELQKKIIEAYNKSSIIYWYMCDYRTAYELLIKALPLSEECNDQLYQSKIYANIGNIFFHFNKLDVAKSYYTKALSIPHDEETNIVILSNLGAVETEIGNIDSAFYYFNKSLQISKNHNTLLSSNIASLYKKTKQYDSAFYYYHLSLDESEKNNKLEYKTEILSELGKLFFEIRKFDSAIYYIDLSNTFADKINFLKIIADNNLILSKIAEIRGNTKKAFEHYKKYATLQDSISNANIFGDINQLQHLYEITKVNQQIESLVIEQQLKDHAMHYQKIIWFITLVILFLVSTGLLFIYLQNRRLSKAYDILFKKNIEIMELQESASEKSPKKNKSIILTDEKQQELIERILLIMKDTSIICDSEFSMEKLATLLQSNRDYISQVINTGFKINFRSLLSEYRIKEAQRLFSTFDIKKYTIEYVANKVGFKSPNAFRYAFKDITGVSPGFYVKAIEETRSQTSAIL